MAFDMAVDFDAIQAQCAPHVARATLKALVKHESGMSPFAIGINKGFRLVRQPASKEEAIATAKFLLLNGYNFDAGWTQINVANIKRWNLSLDDVFDACKNIRIAADLYADNYYRALSIYKNPDTATLAALSAHNTGNFTAGFRNGYVNSVAALAIKYQNDDIPINQNRTRKPITIISPQQKKNESKDVRAIPKFQNFNERTKNENTG